ASGKPLAFKTVNLAIGGQASQVFTDSQGQASFTFNPETSKGLITASFKDSEFKAQSTLRLVQTNPRALATLFDVFGFLAGYFFIFLIVRHCFRKVF
ncbi:MAG: hypothetical protein Q7R70_06620, partial [Candidatus Diapherotrites archaeon]|nr:hypothetical protein [Candidatus Diapherotrites archaeon]